jgi:hypothetical protein
VVAAALAGLSGHARAMCPILEHLKHRHSCRCFYLSASVTAFLTVTLVSIAFGSRGVAFLGFLCPCAPRFWLRTPPLQTCKWAASRFRVQGTLEYPFQCELFEVYFVIPLCSLRPFLESIRVVELRVEEGLGFTRGA